MPKTGGSKSKGGYYEVNGKEVLLTCSEIYSELYCEAIGICSYEINKEF